MVNYKTCSARWVRRLPRAAPSRASVSCAAHQSRPQARPRKGNLPFYGVGCAGSTASRAIQRALPSGWSFQAPPVEFAPARLLSVALRRRVVLEPARLIGRLAQAVMLKQAQAREPLVNLPLEALQLYGVFLEGVLELP